MIQTLDVAGVEELKIKIIRLLFPIQDVRILKDAINLLESEINVSESYRETNFMEKSIYKAENGSLIPIKDFCQFIKDCEESESKEREKR